jgi:predicted transcriptional regulator
MKTKTLFLPIKPIYLLRILNGDKTIELRKRNVKHWKDGAILYATSPEKRIKATCKIAGIVHHTPEKLWELLHGFMGVSKDEYDSYFAGKKKAFAIILYDVKIIKNQTKAWELLPERFQIPQSFCYVNVPIDEII